MNSIFEGSSRPGRAGKTMVLAVLITALSACGFHLRSAVELPEGMKSVFAQNFAPGSPFLSYLDQNLKHADGELTSSRKDAGLVLKAVDEQFLRRAVSLSQTGKANMYELKYVLTYNLQDSAGELILASQTITVVRDYFNPQVEVIGKSTEEEVIRKEMYQEAVRNLLRRVEVALHGRSAAPLKSP
ncbi:MAG: LPS assembly lipoprotein LptE [Methylococcales bacterium]